MPSATGQSWEKYKKEFADDEEPEKKITPLTDEYVTWRYLPHLDKVLTRNARDIQVLKTYGAAPYATGLRRLEKQIKEKQTSVNEKIGTWTVALTAWLEYVLSADTAYRSERIRHRSSAATSMGHSSGSATNVRRPSLTSRPLYQNHCR